MLRRITKTALAAPRRVLAVVALLLVAGAVLGAPVAGHLKSGGFTVPDAESTRAEALLADHFGGGAPNLLVMVSAPGGADSAAARAAGEHVVQVLRRASYVGSITSYWDTRSTALRSEDGATALVTASIAGDDDVTQTRAHTLVAAIGTHVDGARLTAGGAAVTYDEVNTSTRKDLAVAEAIAIPITAVALVLVFGSLVAALLPLAIGGVAIVGTLAELRLLSMVTDVSIYAMNMTTALGLALAIDYSLFIVSRYREELGRGRERADAILTAATTAGRTVLFSAMTVALALAALTVFPMYFLRSFAYAGIAVVVIAAAASVVALPAILTLVGPRIDALDLRAGVRRLLRRPAPAPRTVQQGLWYRLASTVMRRPVVIGGVVVAILLLLGSPFLRASFGYPDDRVLGTSTSAHVVGDQLRTSYALDAGSTMNGVVAAAPAPGALSRYQSTLRAVPGVRGVTTTTADGAVRFDVTSDVDPFSAAGKRLVQALRDTPGPDGRQVLWSGWAAFNVDAMAALGHTLPLALGLIALATFVVLFGFTGSVVVPLKALLLNLLSLTATFGAMVWVFQEGHLAGLLGFTPAGYLVANMVVLMFCLAFGMSMDYEVFLLSRISEEWRASARTHDDNTRAVALGLARTGRIVTAAAFLMAIVFAAMVSSSVQFMKLFGLGLTLAVLADATLVRGILVPAFMRLMGTLNWWAPRPLRRVHARFGLSEG